MFISRCLTGECWFFLKGEPPGLANLALVKCLYKWISRMVKEFGVFKPWKTGFSYHHSSHVIGQVTLDHHFWKTKWYSTSPPNAWVFLFSLAIQTLSAIGGPTSHPPGIQISESPQQPDGRKTTKISSLVDGAQRNHFQSHRFFATLSLQHQSSWQNFRG